jgi:nitroimidazol reductase NimA-like FMN-containing flavoprotein (pyridoxamine 5'-phosphate oxidase superfamily)
MKVEELKIIECWEVLGKTNTGRLACSLNDQPYIVPFNFAFDRRKYLYAFSTVGQKVRWMRKNPLVCVEIDDIKNQEDWTTLIVFGRYEELPDVPEFESQRIYAHELLSRRPMWWQPAYVAGTHREHSEEKPVYFRIFIEKITGHRAVSDTCETFIPAGQTVKMKGSWLRGLW